jgi:hypothetical protein
MTEDSLKNKRLVGLFLLGAVLFNFPILSLFNVNFMVFEIPLLYLYMFFMWLVLIIGILLVTRK